MVVMHHRDHAIDRAQGRKHAPLELARERFDVGREREGDFSGPSPGLCPPGGADLTNLGQASSVIANPFPGQAVVQDRNTLRFAPRW